MLKTAILRQKQEKEELLNTSYIERNKYLTAKSWVDSKLIKVILGPRRSGKSTFALTLLSNRPFMYFNFDDEILARTDGISPDELLKELHIAYGDIKNIFFDEIQNLPAWELFVNRLQRSGYNLTISGSNAHLLSQELTTALTGRHIPIEILPFDFKEYLNAKKFNLNSEYATLPKAQADFMRLLEEYLIHGGFPEIVTTNIDANSYLKILFDSVLLKDVVKRHKVKYAEQIMKLSNYLLNNFASVYSLDRLKNILEFKSATTLEKFISYLEDAYLLIPLQRYSPKTGLRLKSSKKIYIIDNGFISAKAIQNSPNIGKLMENLVLTELVKSDIKPNTELFYYKTRNEREIDFVIKKGTAVTELIQVCYSLQDADVETREVKALLEASSELNAPKLIILTWNEKQEIKKNDLTINVIPLHEWLLNKCSIL